MRVTRGTKKSNKTRIFGELSSYSSVEEVATGFTFDFTPATWISDTSIMATLLFQKEKYSDFPRFTQSLSCTSVIPGGHEAFVYAKEGNIIGLQKLFSTGHVRPNDRNEHGMTLLHVCSLHKCSW